MINLKLPSKQRGLRVAVVIFFLAVIALTLRSLLHIISTSAPDFSVFWTSTHDLLSHRNPYTNPGLYTMNGYPPSTFIYFIPLAIIPYQLAQTIFTIINFFAVPGIVFLSFRILFKKVNLYYFLLFLSLALVSFPTKFTLGMGQVNLIAFLLLLFSFSFYKEAKQETSGILLGAVFLLKPALGFILLFFILKMKWKIVLYSLAVPALATLLIVVGFGTVPFVYWLKEIVPELSKVSGTEIYYNQGIIGFISRLTPDINIRTSLATVISAGLILLVSFFTLKKRKDENLQFTLSLTTLLLIDNLSSQHHFVWLIFPFILLSKYALRLRQTWFWLMLFAAYFLVSWNFKNPQVFYIFPASLLLSNTFYGAVVVYVLTLYCLEKANE